MPIKPENKALYPPNWIAISQRIRERAGHRCENCDLPNGGLIHRKVDGGHRWPSQQEMDMYHDMLRQHYSRQQAARAMGLTRIVLTVAHLDHNPTNCADDNLRALCQYCHLTYDAKHHAQTARLTRRCKHTLELFA